jgi:hypothetical protein
MSRSVGNIEIVAADSAWTSWTANSLRHEAKALRELEKRAAAKADRATQPPAKRESCLLLAAAYARAAAMLELEADVLLDARARARRAAAQG